MPEPWKSNNFEVRKPFFEVNVIWIDFRIAMIMYRNTFSSKTMFVALAVMFSFVFTAAQAQESKYQLENPGFEQWDNETTSSIEPSHWNSFMTATGSLKSTVAKQQLEKSTDTRPGSDGKSSVKITARSVLFVIAQGNLTTGHINAGSLSAADGKGNYNFTDESDDNFNQKITGLPDSLVVWLNVSVSKNAGVSCYLHTAGYFQDPQANDITATVISNAKASLPTTNGWKRVSIPFSYEVTDGTRPKYALVTFNTSDTPGSGKATDYVIIDDVEFIYNSELGQSTYDGKALTFVDGAATVDGAYDESKLSLLTNAVSATVETSYYNQVLTITVKGDDFSANADNKHVYTITFSEKNAADKALGFTERSFVKDQLCTVCLPFDISAAEAASLGSFYTLGGLSNGKIYFTPAEQVEMNRPYVFKPAADGLLLADFVAAETDLAPVTETADGISFTGVGEKTTLNSDATVSYYGFRQQDGAFVKASVASVDVYRAYVSMPANQPAAQNVYQVVLSEPTGITAIETDAKAAPIYNIQGMQVDQMQKGHVYIVNGKKVVK